MADVENILNDDDFCGDTFDTPKEGIEQHKKREELKSVINKGKAYLLRGKWTQKLDKASDETINKTYAEYKVACVRPLDEKTRQTLHFKFSTSEYFKHLKDLRNVCLKPFGF